MNLYCLTHGSMVRMKPAVCLGLCGALPNSEISDFGSRVRGYVYCITLNRPQPLHHCVYSWNKCCHLSWELL
jgi:hypothetical protein